MAITLCMIVRDEAARLPRCLASVVGVVDEAVIVDTGSQDETVAIARQWGARVYEVPWQEDFAAARNIALQYVTTEWVLVLDADETLTPSFAAVLPEICRQPNWLVVILLRQELGVVPPYTYVSRLFRHHPDLFFQRPYHETIDDSVLALQQREPHWQIGQVNRVAIVHSGYLGSQRQQKQERAERIMRRHLEQHPQDAYLWSKLAGVYLAKGAWQQAQHCLEQGLKVKSAPPAVAYELHYQRGNLYAERGEWPAAIQAYETALRTPTPAVMHLATYLRLAEAQKQLKRWGDALATYDRLQAVDPTCALAYQNQGALLLRLGQVRPALDKLQQAIHLLQVQNPQEAQRLSQELQAMGLL
ncbi:MULTISPECIES: TPR domain-containing glycosyltransferase [unclassified Thermosynechococcus]|uniref:tetratricopeptide repeat-containing glycosyltransferase family 2 protein n=1 Tax=unclassified Thermosynechococcus TaxID=2622553 RepID=UPI002670F9F5|nr:MULTISPECIES: TPR domain-containing glycosyltransferase [unclassified Thermosynechococcus]WKT83382.1 glycosyltransferase [Thermosynechococcus sp. HY596]WNC62512.1 glycosyltransferase [Thermosynechococcus sp. HY591]WNC65068.1 glycosyltransferase [Thermosynechococcus sp. HY593]